MQHDAGSTSRQNPLLWSFMGELDTQCANAEMAYTALVMALSERGPDGSRGRAQQRKIFFYAHAFMTHAAMISRILWPSREVHERDIEEFGLEHGDALKTIRKERGKQVRKALRCEISPLKDFAAGDYLERNDARLEVWTLSSASANARDMMVSPLDIGNGSDPPNVIRHFDPITMTYTFLSEQFDLPAIAALLSRIHRAVARWVTAQGHD